MHIKIDAWLKYFIYLPVCLTGGSSNFTGINPETFRQENVGARHQWNDDLDI